MWLVQNQTTVLYQSVHRYTTASLCAIQLASSVFLASAAGCFDMIRQILLANLVDISSVNIEALLGLWINHILFPFILHHETRIWDVPKVEVTVNYLLESAADDQSKACLLAVSCPVCNLVPCITPLQWVCKWMLKSELL